MVIGEPPIATKRVPDCYYPSGRTRRRGDSKAITAGDSLLCLCRGSRLIAATGTASISGFHAVGIGTADENARRDGDSYSTPGNAGPSPAAEMVRQCT